MAVSEVVQLGPLASERLAAVRELIATRPGCAVGLIDAANDIVDPERLFTEFGIPLGGHSMLRGNALVEFVATSDAWLVSDIATTAQSTGSARRVVRLRSGRTAELHLFAIGTGELRTVVVIVPYEGDSVAVTPASTAIVASPRVGVIHCDSFGTIESACDSTCALLGYPRVDLEGRPIVNILLPEDQEAAIVNWVAAKAQRGVALRWRCRAVRSDRSTLWMEATLTYEIDAAGEGDVRVDLYDISQEVAATAALAAETELLGLLTETLPVGVAKFDRQGRIEHANGRLSQLLAPASAQDVLGRAARGELDTGDAASAFAALFEDGTGCSFVVDRVDGDGNPRHLEWTIRAVRSSAGAVTGGVVCIADVTEAGHLRAALEHRARTDALTGCLNRAGTVSALEAALAAVGPAEGVGLLFIDLNGFKDINDACGHAIGDAVLEIVARRLRDASRDEDVLGRLGGDEFVVIAPHLNSPNAALVLARRVAAQLHGVAAIGQITVGIEASIGVAWTPAGSATDLLARADAAMYAAKQVSSAIPVLAPSIR